MIILIVRVPKASGYFKRHATSNNQQGARRTLTLGVICVEEPLLTHCEVHSMPLHHPQQPPSPKKHDTKCFPKVYLIETPGERLVRNVSDTRRIRIRHRMTQKLEASSTTSPTSSATRNPRWNRHYIACILTTASCGDATQANCRGACVRS